MLDEIDIGLSQNDIASSFHVACSPAGPPVSPCLRLKVVAVDRSKQRIKRYDIIIIRKRENEMGFSLQFAFHARAHQPPPRRVTSLIDGGEEAHHGAVARLDGRKGRPRGQARAVEKRMLNG